MDLGKMDLGNRTSSTVLGEVPIPAASCGYSAENIIYIHI